MQIFQDICAKKQVQNSGLGPQQFVFLKDTYIFTYAWAL